MSLKRGRKLLHLQSTSILTNKQISQTRKTQREVQKLQVAFEEDSDKHKLFKFYSERSSFSERYRPLADEDYTRYLSSRALCRQPAMTRLITSLAYKVGSEMISLAEGMPNEEMFPFNSLRVGLKNGSEMKITGKELSTALQYVPSTGLPALVSTLKEFQELVHRPPQLPRDVLISNGAQHGIYQCCELLLEPNDPVIMAEYTYTGVHVALRPYNPEILGIPEDKDGMLPDALESTLAARAASGQRMPKMMYIIPVGNNPTGTVLSEDRRREVYRLACEYDFLIVEDDPYMFLNYTDKPVSSFLSMDSCGRVLRLDSLSKVVSSGLRAGWVTAPRALVARLELHMQAELLHSCSVAQTIQNRFLLDRKALQAQIQAANAFYKHRRDKLNEALCSAGVDQVAEWNIPDAGLFLWLKVNDVTDVYDLAFRTGFEKGLLLIPGHGFLYNTEVPSQYLRLTFSKIPLDKMDIAARTLVDLIKHHQKTCQSKQQKRSSNDR